MTTSVLIYRVGSMGDMVVALPFFHAVRRRFPDARRILLTNVPVSSKAAASQSVLGQGALFDDSISYPLNMRSPRGLWELARRIRQSNARTLVYLMPARGLIPALRDAVFFRCCGIEHIVGLPTNRDVLQNRLAPDTGMYEPESERLARALWELGPVDLTSRDSWDLHLTGTELAGGRAVISSFGGRPFFAFNMGGKAAEKDWGSTRWLELLHGLAAAYPDHGFLIVGAKEDSMFAEQVRQTFPERTIDACGLISPRECAAALKEAALFVGHDSGPLHLAASVGVPCVGLYGSLNQPRTWHPYGLSHRVIHKMEGIDAITVAEAAHAVHDIMERKPR